VAEAEVDVRAVKDGDGVKVEVVGMASEVVGARRRWAWAAMTDGKREESTPGGRRQKKEPPPASWSHRSRRMTER
jgi:hypothetical protein